MRQINSLNNPKVKQIIKLINSKSYRHEMSLAIVYGWHLVEEAIKHDLLHSLYISERNIKEFSGLDETLLAVEKYIITEDILTKINLADSDVKVIGVINIKPSLLPKQIYNQDCVVLDNIQDPGNLGTILRSSAAGGIKNIILAKNCVDPYNLKVIRASQGIQFGLNLISDVDLLMFINSYQGEVLVTLPKAGTSLYLRNLTRPCAWIFGNEGSGISSSLLNEKVTRISIPMTGDSESLNVAMAATICIFEMLRQRELKNEITFT